MIIFSPIFHTRLIRCFCSSSCRSSLTEPLPLQNLLRSGFTPTLKSIVQFLLFPSRTRWFNTLLHFFSRMESNQIKGNSQAHSIVTWALLDLQKYEEAEHFMGTQMTEASKLRRNRMWDSLIQGLCINRKDPEMAFNEGDMSKAIEVLELMTDEKVKYPFDNFVSSSVISGFCKIGKPEIAVKFLKNAVDSGALEPNIVTYTALVCDLVCRIEKQGLALDVVLFSCWICDFPESACELYLVMRRKGSVITSKTYYTILKGLIGGGKDSLTQSFLNIFLKEYGLEELKVSRILAYDICLKGVDDALRFLDKMKDKPATVTLPVTLFNTLIKNGRVLDAYKLVMVAGDGLSILDAFDYSLIVDSLCKVGYINEALDLCSFAKNKWVTLDIIIYNSVINGLCGQGHLVEAFRLFDSLERINLVPTEITYATSIDALRREGFLLDAKQFFERMVLKGFKPNTHVYNSIIDGYCKIGDMNDALKVLYDFDLKSLQPDEFTVSIVINGFCLKGDMEGAIKFFVELEGKGTLPDFLGFLYLLRGLCTKGRMEEARTILREMLHSQSVVEQINRVDVEVETDSLEGFLHTVRNEIGCMFFPVRGSPNTHQQSHKLDKPYDREASGTVVSTSVTYTDAELDSQLSEMKKVEKVAENYDGMERRSQFNDFDYCYKQIAILCSSGEIQKASQLAKEMVPNFGRATWYN
ncbi:pentatricopeptide repeat-containing protein [Pyrus ussuriensis x Pyrus communis]|uniref:Pentatricopeptide repeat-containing protein n=1 Tax=Pyrus ussuriensis x Pyrus communis TaxID=2448454 RepID=A0A5N5HHH1_9ROSA|nr:pentatricopeptide repeat-containing protein [Pyrus ussuriensis x Pyrus communis]